MYELYRTWLSRQLSFVPRGVKNIFVTMNSDTVHRLRTLIFRDSPNETYCKFCPQRGIHFSASCIQDLIHHVYYNHRRFWDVAVRRTDWISSRMWGYCFKSVNLDNHFSCQYCPEIIDAIDLRPLHRHMLDNHMIIILAFTLLYN